MPRPVMLGIVGDSGSGQDDRHARARARARRGPGHGVLHRRLPPLRPRVSAPSATSRRSTRTATTSTSSPSISSHLRQQAADHEARLPAHRRHVRRRPIYFDAGALRRRRGPARLLQPRARRQLRRARLPRSARGAAPRTGRCSATAHGAATRPTRCSTSSTGASPTRSATSGPSATTPTSSISFQPGDTEDQEHLDCKLTLRDTLTHPDLTGVVSEDDADGIMLVERPGRPVELYVPGRIRPERAARIEEAIWEKMHFASHLRQERSASSRSAPTFTAPTRSRSCSC